MKKNIFLLFFLLYFYSESFSAVITGGVVQIFQGGTGATTTASARANLGIGTSSTPNFSSITLSNLTANRAIYSDSSKTLQSSNSTSTELGYLSGVSSAIQTQLNGKQTTTLTSGNILVGNTSNTASSVAMSGDATLKAGGTLTLSTVAAAKGGTGLSSYTTGDLLYASGSSALSKLAAVSSGSVLISQGTSTSPSWRKLDLTGQVTKVLPVVNGGSGASTLTGYLKGNGTSAFTSSSTIPTSDLSGTIGVTSGGTGLSSIGINTLLYASAANTLSTVAANNNAVLITDPSSVPVLSGTLPLGVQSNITQLGTISSGSWGGSTIAINKGGTALTGTPTNGQLLIGNGSGYALATLTGTASQITVTNGSGSITLSTPQNLATSSTPTFSTTTLTGATLKQGVVSANTGASYTVNPVNGSTFILTMNAATPALTFQTPVSGITQTIFIELVQDGTGGRAPSFSGVTYASGSAPAIAQTAAAKTYLTCVFDGTTATLFAAAQNIGITDGSNASSGYIGEVISSTLSSGSAITLSSGTIADVTSIALTPGDWSIFGEIAFSGGVVTATQSQGFIGTVSGNDATGRNTATNTVSASFGSTSATDIALALPVYRVNITSNTTYYLKANSTFSVGTATAYGSISARRMR